MAKDVAPPEATRKLLLEAGVENHRLPAEIRALASYGWGLISITHEARDKCPHIAPVVSNTTYMIR